jgi:hypothetical protein
MLRKEKEGTLYKYTGKDRHFAGDVLAKMGACFDELMKLGAISRTQFEAAQLKKRKKKPITTQQAAGSLKRLKRLEETKDPTGAIARAAGVGAVAFPIATLAQRAIAGKRAVGDPGAYRGIRDIAAQAGRGGVVGGLLPSGRHKLEREVEKQKLREYVGRRRRGTLRSRIKRTTGI